MLTRKERRVLNKIMPKDGFAYFSGFRERCENLPTIYRGSGKFHVVGRGINKEFDTLDEAVEKFKKHFKIQ